MCCGKKKYLWFTETPTIYKKNVLELPASEFFSVPANELMHARTYNAKLLRARTHTRISTKVHTFPYYFSSRFFQSLSLHFSNETKKETMKPKSDETKK